MGSVPWSNDAEKLAWYIERAKQSGEAVVRLERKLDAKDAEIARLKRENFDLNGCLLAEQESVEKREMIIRDFAQRAILAERMLYGLR